MAETPNVMQVAFVKAKVTPGTVVFKEVEEEGKPIVIGTLYVKKWFAGSATAVMVSIAKAE
jgi:hypothetical protein